MTRRRIFIFAIIFIAILCGIAFWRARHLQFDVRRIVLISIDTCRADHLGCYGYEGDTTPNLDRIARQGILFEDVVSPVPMTLPSHSSMLTGTNPPYHGVHLNLDQKLGPSNVTLAEMLQKHGFSTGAIVSAFVLASQFGLDQGFDTYSDQFEEEHKTVNVNERKGAEATHYALQWLEKHQDEKFFLFLHYFDPHDPYEPPEPFKTRFRDSPYDGEVAFVDDCVGQVVAKLQALGIYESTLIIITADHGEMFGEHGEPAHSYFIYEGATRVPLIIKLPGAPRPALRIKDTVGLIDIVPTICSLLDLEPPAQVVGEDLSMALRKGSLPTRARGLYSESFTPRIYGANPLLSLRDGAWKYIQTTRPELYNLKVDPTESRNLADQILDQALKMEDQLEKILDDQIRSNVDSAAELDAQTRKRLESIGYVGGGANDSPYDLPPDRDDPKDLIHFHNDFQRVNSWRAQDRNDLAWELCEELVKKRPNFQQGVFTLCQIAKDVDKIPSVIGYLMKILEEDPQHATARNFLGIVRAQQGRHEEAIEHYHRVLEDRPDDAALHSNLGVALAELGQTGEAISHYEKSIQIDADYADAHFNLGKALEAKHAEKPRNGWLDKSISHYKKALALNPDFANAHINLGSVVARQGKIADAIEHFHRGVKVEPDHFLGHYNLAKALHAQGNLGQALVHYRKAVTLDPGSPGANYRYANALVASGRLETALKHYRTALKLDDDLAPAHNDLSWLLATRADSEVVDPQAALKHARRAAELTKHRDPGILDTLAVAQAACGQFDDAVETAHKALAITTGATKAEELAAKITSRLKLYEKQIPYREEEVAEP